MSTTAASPTTEDTEIRPAALQLLGVAGALVAVTIAAAIVGWFAPELAPGGTPQPTLYGTVDEATSILWNNVRVLAVPLGLAAGRWSIGLTRPFGDAIVAAMMLASAVTVGLAIGAHGRDLWPYLPHLPLEWAALAVAGAGWVAHRGRRATWRSLGPYAAAALLLATAAAVVETVAIPHA